MEKSIVYQTTKKGLEKLIDELKFREEELRKKIANTLNEMRNQGDLRENDGYSMAVEEQNINEEKILELKDKIKNSEIVKCDKKDRVCLGDTVTLKNGKSIQYDIVGEEEANPLEKKISYKSPIGSSILGKKVGEKVTISTPSGQVEYKIENIS